jgi:molybdenum cofactor cytidylyltransferase
MFRMASELVAEGHRVVTTTTTHIFAHQVALAPHHIIHDQRQSADRLIQLLSQQMAVHPHILVVGPSDHNAGKACGVEPDMVEAMAAMPQVACVLNEADGARMRPFKAPAEHEPVVPGRTTLLVPMVGIDVIGRPLTDEYVHRAALAARLAGVELGVEVSPEIVAVVLTHPQGGLKGLPIGARVVPFINKVESGMLGLAHDVAGRLLACQQVESVVIGSVQHHDPVIEVWSRVAAVVLAAGASSRFGAVKQLLPWQGGTLLSHVVDTARESLADPVVVVLGNRAEECRAALDSRPVEIVTNEDWAKGQSTSVKAGLAAVPDTVCAALFALADQPMVTVHTINALITRYRLTLASVVWPEHAGERGNPVLFDRALFPELMRLSQDAGGRSVLKAHVADAERVPVDDAGILFDIDTPADYQKRKGLAKR